MRYDLSLNAWANEIGVDPFYSPGRPDDANNIQPRLGFAYSISDQTVVRGGSGLYFADALTIDAFWPYYNAQLARIQINNDGRPDFASNPLNGQPVPTLEQAQVLFCNSPAQAANFAAWQARNFTGTAPCLLNAYQEMPAPDQHEAGAKLADVNRHVAPDGSSLAFDAITIYGEGLREGHDRQRQPDLRSGRPVMCRLTNRARLPYPSDGITSMIPAQHPVHLSRVADLLTRRFRNRWQASGTYTLSGFWDAQNQPFSGSTSCRSVQPDLGNDFTPRGH